MALNEELKRSGYSLALKLGIAGIFSFLFGLFVFPHLYDLDYTNNNPDVLWAGTYWFLLLCGLALTVASLVWMAFFRAFKKTKVALVAALCAGALF